MAKLMIEHDFYRIGGSESVGSSDTRLEFVVQTLDGTERDFIARLEPVQDKWLVGADHAGDFLHRLEARSHHLFAPLVHEFFRPRRGDILPEQLELFLEQVGAYGLQVVREQVRESDCLAFAQVLGALQQAPARVSEDHLRAPSAGFQGACFLGPNLIEGFVHLGGNVIAVEDVQRVGRVLGDDVQIGLPHVRADELDERTTFFAKPDEELTQTLLLPILDHKQQPLHILVDLIHQRQKLALLPVDLIHAEGRNTSAIDPFAPPVHRHLDRAKYALPAGLEAPGYRLPAQQFGPTGEEPGKALRNWALAQSPRQILHVNATPRTLQPPRRVHEPGRHPPQRHKLKAPLYQFVVARRREQALRTLAELALMRAKTDLDPRRSCGQAPPSITRRSADSARLIDKPFQRFHPVKQRLQGKVHGSSRSDKIPVCATGSPYSSATIPSSPPASARSAQALRSRERSPPTRSLLPASSPADASMSTASNSINAGNAAISCPLQTDKPRSNAASKGEENSSLNISAKHTGHPQILRNCQNEEMPVSRFVRATRFLFVLLALLAENAVAATIAV